MTMPNFLIVGAAKAGTSALASYLAQHPDIFITTPKEPRYFVGDHLLALPTSDPQRAYITKRSVLKRSEYTKLFATGEHCTARGEASVHYLYYHDESIPRIKAELGDIPIIIVLRNPVDRAFSNYQFNQRFEMQTFEEALKQEATRKAEGVNPFLLYRDMGLYFNQVGRFLNEFSQVHVLLYEDFRDNNVRECKCVFQFLGVAPEFTPDVSYRVNRTKHPRHAFIESRPMRSLISSIKERIPRSTRMAISARLEPLIYRQSAVNLKTETRAELIEFFQDDIIQLEPLLNRDLSAWLLCER